jgi:hypothetical protein
MMGIAEDKRHARLCFQARLASVASGESARQS